MSNLISVAQILLQNGISFLPVDHTNKRPAINFLPRDLVTNKPTWKLYQLQLPTEADIHRWFNGAGVKAIAVIAGKVSDGLLVIDFDVARFYDAWLTKTQSLLSDLPVLPTQQTGGGGFQILLRCPKPGKNLKLAFVENQDEKTGRNIAIETRGEGGYAIIDPSFHPNGNQYLWIKGNPENIPTLSQSDAELLLQVARSLCEAPFTLQELQRQQQREEQAKTTPRSWNGWNGPQPDVIGEYNCRYSVEDILVRHGYKKGWNDRLIRPGGKSPSVVIRDDRSYHHSSNDSLNNGHTHTAFSAFCKLDHNDDIHATVKAAAVEMGMEYKAGTYSSVSSPMKQIRQIGSRDTRPDLLLHGDIEQKSQQIVAHIERRNDPPKIFLRGRELVYLTTSRGKTVLEVFNGKNLRAYLCERINFKRLSTEKNAEGKSQFIEAPTDIRVSLCENILLRSHLPFPPIEEVIRLPVLAPNGELITQSGYRADLEAYVDIGNLNVEVPTKITAMQIVKAKSLIFNDLFVDFPLVDDASKAHALALGLLPFVRHVIDGCTPPHLTTSTVPRTGKTLLVQALSILAVGKEPKMVTESRNDEEWRKRITSLLMESPAHICIDNVNNKMNSGILASLFTSRWWSDRILGANKMVELRNNAVWTITANNPQASEELTKRCVWIAMDPKMENPEERVGFKHHPLLKWVYKNQQTLIEAFLILVQAWVAQGMPRSKATLGSFESWAEVIGGILESVGIPGFLTNRKVLNERTNVEGMEWKEFVEVWWTKHQSSQLKVSELRELANETELLGQLLGDKSDKSQDSRLGRALLKKRERIFELENDIVSIKREKDSVTKRNVWRLSL